MLKMIFSYLTSSAFDRYGYAYMYMFHRIILKNCNEIVIWSLNWNQRPPVLSSHFEYIQKVTSEIRFECT
jgi:hypothetical protein